MAAADVQVVEKPVAVVAPEPLSQAVAKPMANEIDSDTDNDYDKLYDQIGALSLVESGEHKEPESVEIGGASAPITIEEEYGSFVLALTPAKSSNSGPSSKTQLGPRPADSKSSSR